MKPDRVYLSHMHDAIAKVERYLAGVDYETFTGNDMMIDAVVRELEIIGEAARNLSVPFIEQHPDIPWSRIRRMRNILIHDWTSAKCTLGLYSSRKSYSSIFLKNQCKSLFTRHLRFRKEKSRNEIFPS